MTIAVDWTYSNKTNKKHVYPRSGAAIIISLEINVDDVGTIMIHFCRQDFYDINY